MTIEDVDAVYATISAWPVGRTPESAGLFLPRQIGRPLAISARGFGIMAIIEAVSAIASGAVTTAAIINGQCRDPESRRARRSGPGRPWSSPSGPDRSPPV